MEAEAPLGLILWTTDIEGLADFLVRAAGMRLDERHPGYAALSAGPSRLYLHADEAYRGHPWYEALAKHGAARGIGAEIRLQVPDVDYAYTAATRIGGIPVQAPCNQQFGVRECQVLGPDGFLVSLWSVSEASAK